MRRDGLDELKFKLFCEAQNGYELMDLDAGILTKLRSDFENDLSLDEGFSGLMVEKIAVGKAQQAIAAFDHFVVKWEPATWAFEVSSTKIGVESKHEGLQAKLKA